MNSLSKVVISLLLLSGLIGCNNNSKQNVVSVIPQVNEIAASTETLSLDGDFVIYPMTDDAEILTHGQNLAKFVNQYTPYFAHTVEGKALADSKLENAIGIYLAKLPQGNAEYLPREGYTLEIKQDGIFIRAENTSGIFYAIQSLKQILLNDVVDDELQGLLIVDQPAFPYRGLMLDVSRHFFSVTEIKSLLDIMALYKLNKFHWHLTDDAGWRIEIKQLPLLTEIGSYRHESQVEKNYDPFIGDGVPHQGFYTQEQIRDIVAYAQARHIEVIPEIDMPGHVLAALAAYPKLACTDGPFEVSGRWGIHRDILCPNTATFEFIETVLSEVATIFPSPFIHIGGDEVPTTRWQQSKVAQEFIQKHNLFNEAGLQGYFFEFMNEVLIKNGKQAIVWDETLEKSISSTTTVMAWRGQQWAIDALEQGHQVILAVKDYSYFDYYQGEHSQELLAQCCSITLEDVYHTPVEFEDTTLTKSNVLGGQAQMWTAFISDYQHLEYMLLPRMLAHSEVYWTSENEKSWDHFKSKVDKHIPLFEKLGMNYRPLSQ
ncbi:beta-N-acetylhexosaminidase [Colwellia sp. MEBiC06753]